MRASIIAIAISALAACGQAPAEMPPEVAAAEATQPAVAPGPSAGIDGWEIDMTAYDKIGAQLPVFTVKGADGAVTGSDTLRGRWTIIGMWPATGAPEGEDNFAAALVSAARQDPDLDVLMIHPAATTHPWPVMIDDGGATATALALPAQPAYLLIGPDLTIEGYRGALSATPDDGIKSVIRGVAEVRKQIAAPQ